VLLAGRYGELRRIAIGNENTLIHHEKKPAMPIPSKKVQVVTSAPTVNSAQRRVKPAKRVKKSKVNTEVKANDVESFCPTFFRSLSSDSPAAKEMKQTSDDGARSVTECEVANSEECKAGVRKRPNFEETMGHLFGPDQAKPKARRRHWEMDTYSALFGPDGQMMMSKYPRHYDIFELHRDMRIRKRKQHLQDTQSELLGDAALSRPCSTTSVDVTHDRLFGSENLESSEGGSPAQLSATVKVS